MKEKVKQGMNGGQKPRFGGPQPGAGPPLGSANNESHGYYRAKKLLERGLEVIPTESPLFQVLADKRRQIQEDLGGRENLTQLQQDLIETYMVSTVLLNSVDGYILRLLCDRRGRRGLKKQDALGLVDKVKHKLRPIVEQRSILVQTTNKLATTLGLERKQKRVPSLQEYLASKEVDEEE